MQREVHDIDCIVCTLHLLAALTASPSRPSWHFPAHLPNLFLVPCADQHGELWQAPDAQTDIVGLASGADEAAKTAPQRSRVRQVNLHGMNRPDAQLGALCLSSRMPDS